MGGINDLVSTLHAMLPQWAVIAVLAGVGLCIVPFWLRSIRLKQIRGKVRSIASTTNPQERQQWIEEVLILANNRVRLTTLAHAAKAAGLHALATTAIDRLEDTAVSPHEFTTLRDRDPEPGPGPLHPIEVATRIDALLEQGLRENACLLLAQALDRLPNDPDLQAIHDRIEAIPQENVDAPEPALSAPDTIPSKLAPKPPSEPTQS